MHEEPYGNALIKPIALKNTKAFVLNKTFRKEIKSPRLTAKRYLWCATR